MCCWCARERAKERLRRLIDYVRRLRRKIYDDFNNFSFFFSLISNHTYNIIAFYNLFVYVCVYVVKESRTLEKKRMTESFFCVF
jgi:hypothetical protein